jgi:EmrB/QacA subfamily drug resistance transporter
MATLDSSIVNIALPTLQLELDTSLARIKWIVILYLLVITCLLLPFGRLSDLIGRKRVFMSGFATFTIGSALCASSDTLNFLLVARVIQAVGAAMLMANGPAIITQTFDSTQRGKALGTLAMVVSAGLVTGPSLGGILLKYLGWTSIFWVNIPVGILGLALVYKYVPKDSHPSGSRTFDWAGTFLQLMLLLLFTVVVDPPMVSISGSEPLPVSRWLIVLLMVGLGVVFTRVEAAAESPLFDLSLLKIRTFWTANVASYFTFVAYSAVTVLIPFYFAYAQKMSPDQAGVMMTAIPLTIFVVAPISGRLADRFGSKELSVLGALIGAVTLAALSGIIFGNGITGETPQSLLWLGLSCIGFATGVFQSPNNSAIMSAVPPQKLGVASALLATIRNLGLATGTGMASGIFSYRQSMGESFLDSLHFTLKIAAVFAVLASIASLGKESRSFVGWSPKEGEEN